MFYCLCSCVCLFSKNSIKDDKTVFLIQDHLLDTGFAISTQFSSLLFIFLKSTSLFVKVKLSSSCAPNPGSTFLSDSQKSSDSRSSPLVEISGMIGFIVLKP